LKFSQLLTNTRVSDAEQEQLKRDTAVVKQKCHDRDQEK